MYASRGTGCIRPAGAWYPGITRARPKARLPVLGLSLNGAAGGVMTTTLDDVTKKIKAELLAEHPARNTVLTESVSEAAWCRRTGPSGDRRWPGRPGAPVNPTLRMLRVRRVHGIGETIELAGGERVPPVAVPHRHGGDR
jgi:hypothetical protein